MRLHTQLDGEIRIPGTHRRTRASGRHWLAAFECLRLFRDSQVQMLVVGCEDRGNGC